MDILWDIWQRMALWATHTWAWLGVQLQRTGDSSAQWQGMWSWSTWDRSVQYVVGIATIIGALSTMIGFFQLLRSNRLHKTRRQEEILGKLVSLTSALVFELNSLSDFDLDEIREARKDLLKCVQGESHILDSELRAEIKRKWIDINKDVLAFTKKHRVAQSDMTAEQESQSGDVRGERAVIAQRVRDFQTYLETEYQKIAKKLP